MAHENHPDRSDRFHVLEHEKEDHRTFGEHDRDRVLHCSALRRLAGVTQVISPSEAPISHSRLAHTLKVAQIANRIALKFRRDPKQKEVIQELGVDADVVEAAALAHDLGHPPFGHTGEQVLKDRMSGEGHLDAFEANAQSFRIVTKLALRRTYPRGLNLTRATLSAVLKYPWLHSPRKGEDTKWGAYSTEEEELMWAREQFSKSDHRRSAEAEIMDWADDIAYSVHDVEDFYKAGLIPLERLVTYNPEREFFLNRVITRWQKKRNKPSSEEIRMIGGEIFDVMIDVREPYAGRRDQRGRLRACISKLIDRYINSIELKMPSDEKTERVRIDEQQRLEVDILKELTWIYVIENPALAREEYGKRYVLQTLFAIFFAESVKKSAVLPIACQEELERMADASDDTERERIIADTICTLTDNEALRMFRVLTGLDPGLIFDNSLY